jgi:hypothetical protein
MIQHMFIILILYSLTKTGIVLYLLHIGKKQLAGHVIGIGTLGWMALMLTWIVGS